MKNPMTLDKLLIGITWLIDIIQSLSKAGRSNRPPRILLLTPIEVHPSAPNGRTEVYRKFYGDEGRKISLAFPEVYQRIAREKGCYFLNAQRYAAPGPANGIHMDENSHIQLGKAVAKFIRHEVK